MKKVIALVIGLMLIGTTAMALEKGWQAHAFMKTPGFTAFSPDKVDSSYFFVGADSIKFSWFNGRWWLAGYAWNENQNNVMPVWFSWNDATYDEFTNYVKKWRDKYEWADYSYIVWKSGFSNAADSWKNQNNVVNAFEIYKKTPSQIFFYSFSN